MSRWLALGLLASCLLAGCGGGGAIEYAATVGDSRISVAEVDRWMLLLSPEHFVPDPPSYGKCVAHQLALEPESASSRADLKRECRQQYDQLRGRALSFLITSRWLVEEAASEGVRPTSGEVDRSIRSGGAPQFEGASAAEIRLAAEAALSATRIRAHLNARKVTETAIADYYRIHRARYFRPEQRETYIVEHVPTAAEAARFRSEVASGKRDIARLGLHEMVTEKHPAETVPGKRALARAIFTTRPGVLTSIFKFDRQYTFLEVRHVKKPFYEPLSEVSGSIHALLSSREQAAFTVLWRREWKARTDCLAGYMAPQCRQAPGDASSARLALPE
jgi:foldase protein PrsA